MLKKCGECKGLRIKYLDFIRKQNPVATKLVLDTMKKNNIEIPKGSFCEDCGQVWNEKGKKTRLKIVRFYQGG